MTLSACQYYTHHLNLANAKWHPIYTTIINTTVQIANPADDINHISHV